MPRVPLSWLGEHVDLPTGTTAFDVAAALVRVGIEEEGVHGPAVTGPLVVGRVLTAQAEPQKNGRTINWCTVDVGEAEPRGIVCGAHNFEVGDLVVVALPGTVLPGDFEISARKTYGHISDGMICSARELGLGDDHEGIIVLTDPALNPGDDAIALLGLGEQTLEVNVTPDRGYCFSMRGIAREYSHATGATFRDPAAISTPPPTTDGFAVQISDDAPLRGQAGCDRFVARIVRGVSAAAPSPQFMQQRLIQAGMRTVSLAVDVTNYVMLELGQPLHAYDLGALSAPIVVRRSRAGEKLTTLDGVTRELHPEDLLITDSPNGVVGGHILGLAGVMGGAESEVSATTTDLLIEGAHFDEVSIARTSRRHRLSSEASRRFERGVDPELAPVAVQRVVDLLLEYGGGTADAAVTDADERVAREPIELPTQLPGQLVGVPYSPQQQRAELERIGCEVTGELTAATWQVLPPSWRPDLQEPVDLVEEIARLSGYDAIPSVLPTAPAGRGLTPGQRARRSVARTLAEHGYTEVLSYPFVAPEIFDQLALPADDPARNAIRLANPLSDEQPLLRTSVLQTLLETLRRNVGRGITDVAVFEIGLVTAGEIAPAPKIAMHTRPTDDELAQLARAVPDQPRLIAGALAGYRQLPGVRGPGRRVEYADAIEGALAVLRVLRVPVSVEAERDKAPWHPGRCARFVLADGTVVGYAGELHPKVVSAVEIPPRTAAFELNLDAVLAAAPTEPVVAAPVATYPAAKEDLALVVSADVPAAAVLAAVRSGAGPLLEEAHIFDVYTGPQVRDDAKSLAISLRFRAADRTLTAVEIDAAKQGALAAAKAATGAELRAV